MTHTIDTLTIQHASVTIDGDRTPLLTEYFKQEVKA